jgi:hypothetical protein
MSSVQPNVDLQYQKNFKNTQAAKNLPSFINARGDNQYIWVYTRSGFEQGAFYGSFLGATHAIYNRKIRFIPIYALSFGAAYAAFHASSAYFRNEI